jgi:hypothetical protein
MSVVLVIYIKDQVFVNEAYFIIPFSPTLGIDKIKNSIEKEKKTKILKLPRVKIQFA